MGGKHLKRQRAEKSKVQLKKKKLPKGQNVTNTAFTVRKIQTVEQLHIVSKDEPVSNWNVPLKDLLIRLTHHNFTSRLNALGGIKELLSNYPDILKGPMLKPLVTKLLGLITDEEHKVRVTTMNLLSHLFDSVLPSSIIPFHRILTLYVSCAMTHRNAAVQRDSLKFVDVLVKYAPEAIKCNFNQILQHFVRIIKNYLYKSHSGVFSSGKSIQDLEKVKKEIWVRFHQFLIAGYSKGGEKAEYNCRSLVVSDCMREGISMRSLSDFYKTVPDLSVFKSAEGKEILGSDFDLEEFKNLCSLIVPLLFDTWIEYIPNGKFDESSGGGLGQEIGELLSALLNILLFLYETAVEFPDNKAESWFVSNYSAGLNKSFASNFPFLQSIPANCKRQRQGDPVEIVKGNSNSLMVQNLIICYLAYSFKVIKGNGKLETKIENFVLDALTKKTPADVETLSKVVESALNATRHKSPNTILSKVVAVYHGTHHPELQQSLSKILMKIVMEEWGCPLHGEESLRNWMKSLPDRLCGEKVFLEEVKAMLKLITTPNGGELLSELERKAGQIVANLGAIKVEGASELEGRKMVADILYRCNCEVLMEVAKKLSNGEVQNQDLLKYIVSIFSYKLPI